MTDLTELHQMASTLEEHGHKTVAEALRGAADEIEEAKAENAKLREVCHIAEYDDTGIPVCSECGAAQPEDFTVYYCWCCGRRVEMDG